MFNSSMREGKKPGEHIVVREASHDAFMCMLRFIYGGDVVVPQELAVELLGLADRYLLEGLKLLCGLTLARMISVELVTRILCAADCHDMTGSQLKQQCLDYIAENYHTVVGHPNFTELETSPHLLTEIARAVAPRVDETRQPPRHPERRETIDGRIEPMRPIKRLRQVIHADDEWGDPASSGETCTPWGPLA
tara:strand:- start:198 stop:776 length:579 start_codon:yes stop_codon:yes gene_type:complete